MSTPHELMVRMEALLAELGAEPPSRTLELSRELVQLLLDLHGRALAGDADALPAVRLLHGLDPEPAELIPVSRLLSQRAEPEDRCERCGLALAAEHAHVRLQGALLCVCPACAGGERIESRARRISTDAGGERGWNGLGVPVELAFFVRRADGTLVARYPGPSGLIEASIAAEAWTEFAGAHAALEPEVEALLVHRLGGARDVYRVSIDHCHALAGLLRKSWRGLAGGSEAWRQVRGFFDDLREAAHA